MRRQTLFKESSTPSHEAVALGTLEKPYNSITCQGFSALNNASFQCSHPGECVLALARPSF